MGIGPSSGFMYKYVWTMSYPSCVNNVALYCLCHHFPLFAELLLVPFSGQPLPFHTLSVCLKDGGQCSLHATVNLIECKITKTMSKVHMLFYML